MQNICTIYRTKQEPIDPFMVSIAILVGGQSRLKLQQMYGKLFNFQTLQSLTKISIYI